MRRLFTLLLSTAVLIFLAEGCQRIPLYERTTTVNLLLKLKTDIDTEIDMSVDGEIDPEYKEKINGRMPEYVEALFYDTSTNQLVMSQILPPEGGIIEVPSGKYDIVVYNFGTESTQVSNLGYRLDAEAFTSDITKQMAHKMSGIAVNEDSDTKTDSKGYEDDPIIHEHPTVNRQHR